MKTYRVAILGATGVVGRELLKTLSQRHFPLKDLTLLASQRSAGTVISFEGETLAVQVADPSAFKNIDLVLSSAGSGVSRELVPHALESGCVVIDNTSAFRMKADVPLVVPEVNSEHLLRHKGLISNPNCSTAQLVVALKPLHDAFTIKRVIVSTYQAVSGAGNKAIEELYMQAEQSLSSQPPFVQVLPYPIAFNVIPFIGNFEPNGYTDEEMKMTHEVAKIMDADIKVSATCIRVPVMNGHSESVNIEFAQPVDPDAARDVLTAAPSIIVKDKPLTREFPFPLECSGQDEVFVGRIRTDVSHPCGLNLWVVADNLRKGAALNAIQIAEKLIEMHLL